MLNALLSHRSTPDKYLYHYTSQAGLLGIIQNRALWATNLLFLNDSMEVNHAIQMIQENTEKLDKELSPEESKFLKKLSNNFSKFNTPAYQNFGGIYTCSFSGNKDLLSQWRGYCPDGSGFSIGFDFKSSLGYLVEEQDFILVKCEYDKIKQIKMIDEFLERVLGYFHESEINVGEIDYVLNLKVWDDFLALAPILKHPKFEQEEEWRLVSRPKSVILNNMKFRTGKSMLVPYMEIKLTESQDNSKDKGSLSCIPEICFGPTLHPHLSRIVLQNMLDKEQIYPEIDVDGKVKQTKCKVVESEIPYRVHY
jgi:hypothetical protein